MQRFILTGTPGAGKTSLVRALELRGHGVVEEAATDVIALRRALGDVEPPAHESFVDDVVTLQRQRRLRTPASATGIQFHDRSAICTHALSAWIGRPVSATLAAELDRISRERVFERQVFFVRNIGFCEPTAARRISFADSLRFERVHEESYRAFGYELVEVPAGPLTDRVAMVENMVRELSGRRGVRCRAGR